DSSTILNTIADYLGAAFRFNDGSVADRANSFAGAAVTASPGGGDIGGEVSGEQPELGTAGEKILFTGGFNTERFPQLFDDRDGLDGDDRFFRYRAPVTQIVDGDSISFKWVSEVDGVFDTRALGIDTPEDGGDQPFERPVEWEGLANEDLPVIGTGELQVEQACSLLDTGRRPIAPDDPDVAVSSADTATNEASGDGNGRAMVDYGEGPIPLVGVDDNAVAIGSLLVDGGTGDENTTEDLSIPSFDFLLNVWDDQTGGGETVLYDESHGQPALGDKYGLFVDYATYQEGEGAGIGTEDRPKAVYDLQSSQDLLTDLDGAAAVWITPPEKSFGGREIARLRQFMNDGGSVFLHGMDATRENAFTDNLDQLARRLGIRFRFNADRVVDLENNFGDEAYLRASNFDQDYPFFLLRQCDTDEDYDKDRYFGHDYLIYWGNIAGLTGAGGLVFEHQVAEFELDPDAAAFDGLGRPLGYLYADLDNDGEVETNYNKWMIEQGLARVYDGGHSRHDEFLKAGLRAKRDNRGLWRKSEPLETEPIRNRPVEELYIPQATAVRTESGRLRRSRAPVLAEPTANDSEAPLVGIDESRNLAMVGGPMPAEPGEPAVDAFGPRGGRLHRRRPLAVRRRYRPVRRELHAVGRGLAVSRPVPRGRQRRLQRYQRHPGEPAGRDGRAGAVAGADRDDAADAVHRRGGRGRRAVHRRRRVGGADGQRGGARSRNRLPERPGGATGDGPADRRGAGAGRDQQPARAGAAADDEQPQPAVRRHGVVRRGSRAAGRPGDRHPHHRQRGGVAVGSGGRRRGRDLPDRRDRRERRPTGEDSGRGQGESAPVLEHHRGKGRRDPRRNGRS
ncbi:hypothetical protein BRC75_00075, partial [Halobacteriales archaeon QH_7_69_31]